MRSPLPKTQRRVKTLRHPCNRTPNAAIVAVTTCGVSQLWAKNIGFCFHTPYCDTLPVVPAAVAALGVSLQGL
jgi:hypothetical protein